MPPIFNHSIKPNIMEEPKLTLNEHNQYGKTGKLPESYRKRCAEYEAWLKKQPKEEEAQLDEKKAEEDPEVESKPDVSEEKDESEDNEFENLPEGTEFPYNYGGSHYFLSNGEKVQGKQAAKKAQSQLDEKE